MTLTPSFNPQNAESVAYSFKAKWLNLIQQNQIKLFFRKNAPAKKPDRVYFYVGSPHKSIVGLAKITSIDWVSKDEALALCNEGCIDHSELDIYIGHKNKVHVIRIGQIFLFNSFACLDQIQQRVIFHPPQSFCFVSSIDEEIFQELGK